MSKLHEMMGVILAGGLGTRLKSVVADRPKTMAVVCGKPFLAFLLDQLSAAGLRHAVLCTGYLGEIVRDAFGETYGGLKLDYSQEASPLGTGGALRLALPLLDSEDTIVMNGDSYFDTDIENFYSAHRERGALASIALNEMPDTGRYGRVSADDDGRILNFEEKTPGAGWINAGIYCISTRVIGEIPDGVAVSLETQVFPSWIGKGLYGFRDNKAFLDIGTPESYAAAEAFFAGRVTG